jgi:hypothetical protein
MIMRARREIDQACGIGSLSDRARLLTESRAGDAGNLTRHGPRGPQICAVANYETKDAERRTVIPMHL